jgi:serine/threonine-protein kinase
MQGTARRVLQASPAGTPAYMAPEQKESRAMIGPFTDVYLLAATLWALLTGTPPGNRKQPPPGIGCARTWALECLLDALDDDPSMRPQAAPAFIEVLERVLAVVDRPR